MGADLQRCRKAWVSAAFRGRAKGESVNEIEVRQELKALIPPLSEEERNGLESDIVSAGRAYVPLVLWGTVLLDGHNRYEICSRHGLPYTTVKVDGVEDIRDARILVRRTQLNRRNLAMIDRIALAEGNEEDIAAIAKEQQQEAGAAQGHHGKEGGRGKRKVKPLGKNSSQGVRAPKTVEICAKEAGVSHPTYRAGKVVLDCGTPELQQAVREGIVAISTGAELAELPAEKQREVVAKGPKAAKEAVKALREAQATEKRAERNEKLAEISRGNEKLGISQRYPVVYADPPWRYEHIKTSSRAIENQYPTMALGEICALPVGELVTDDAVLLLWTTSPKLAESLEVVTAWGFTYRTCLVWVKDKIGMGYWARQQHELLLVATKGSPPTPEPAARPCSVIEGSRGKHSAKPEAVYSMIERMFPLLPRIELFSRLPRECWAAWGNQA